jgi:sugar phosphate isomerase/epimerase
MFRDFGMDTASLAGSLGTKLAAIRAAGFRHVMIAAADIVGHPGGVAEGVREVRDSGLDVTGLEALRDFEGLAGQLHAYKVDVAKSMLEVCAALGGRLLMVEASSSRHATTDADAIARDLAGLARMAIPLGIRIAYKATPRSRTARDFRAASDLAMRGNCPNLGVAVDAFDVLAAGVALDDLDILDPGQTFLVQISDYMWQELRSAEEHVQTATHFRVFPGEGAHSEGVAQFVSKLDTIGYYGNYSLDVYNDDYLQMPPEAVATRARNAATWLAETVLRRALPVPNLERLVGVGDAPDPRPETP